MPSAATIKAEEVGQPQCIVIVDASGSLLGEFRLSGAKFLNRKSALSKALTSVPIPAPGATIPKAVQPLSALPQVGHVTKLLGGVPTHLKGDRAGGGSAQAPAAMIRTLPSPNPPLPRLGPSHEQRL